MKIIVFGATGAAGSRIVSEAVARGHQVSAAVRNQGRLAKLPNNVQGHIVNVGDPSAVADAMSGHDLAISSLRSPSGHEGKVVSLTKCILQGASRAGIRIIVVGGAARLRLPGGSPHTVLSDPDFLPESVVPTARASFAQAELCRSNDDANWTYASPSALLQPGERRGTYRIGADTLLVDEEGNSEISMEDFAVALLDEAQSARFERASFTAGY